MCYQLMKIRSVSKNAPKIALIPCGKCAECRAVMRAQWSFRLAVEFEHARKHSFQTAFFTLTYRDDCLPHYPKIAFEKGCFVSNVPCFSRADAAYFLDNIRHWLKRKFNVNKFPWFLASDYGKTTKRPHYHGLICVPNVVDMRLLHKAIIKFWSFGFVYPANFEGGIDSHGYEHKPFVISGDVAKACVYAAKYACKSLAFLEDTKGYKFNKKSKIYKRCSCWHMQSRSCGLSFIVDLNDEQKLNAIENGVALLGLDKTFKLPKYLIDKLLFNPTYKVTKDGRRLVRRAPTQFFEDNYEKIFNIKKKRLESLFIQFLEPSFWQGRFDVRAEFSNDKEYNNFLNLLNYNHVSASDCAACYLGYYGLSSDQCYRLNPVDSWFVRFVGTNKLKYTNNLTHSEFVRNKQITDFVGVLLQLTNFLTKGDKTNEKIKFLEQIKDFHTSLNEVNMFPTKQKFVVGVCAPMQTRISHVDDEGNVTTSLKSCHDKMVDPAMYDLDNMVKAGVNLTKVNTAVLDRRDPSKILAELNNNESEEVNHEK